MYLYLFFHIVTVVLTLTVFNLKKHVGLKKPIFNFNAPVDKNLMRLCAGRNVRYFKSHSQSEDLVPLRVEVFVDGVRLQSIVTQLHDTEWVTLTCTAHTHTHTHTHKAERNDFVSENRHINRVDGKLL